jgi:hypothetical protein
MFEAHRLRRTTMFRKATLAIAAAATLGAIALAPTAASAGGGGFGWHPHHHWGHGFGIGLIGGGFDDGCYVTRPVLTPFGYRYRTINVCGY